jgi:hypothetical protein
MPERLTPEREREHIVVGSRPRHRGINEYCVIWLDENEDRTRKYYTVEELFLELDAVRTDLAAANEALQVGRIIAEELQR